MRLESFKLKEQDLWLSPERGIFWENERALIVSDLHFGKTGHFRKAGIAVPQAVYKEDLQRLIAQIQFFKPKQLIIVGDLFHSHANRELDLFKKWRADLEDVEIHLIKGNHDILKPDFYRTAEINVIETSLRLGSFCFRHDLETCEDDELAESYLFSGHIHPGITISGLGKQTLRFPCFYFTDEYCILPAFSRFTGAYAIEPNRGDIVFAIVNDSIIRI